MLFRSELLVPSQQPRIDTSMRIKIGTYANTLLWHNGLVPGLTSFGHLRHPELLQSDTQAIATRNDNIDNKITTDLCFLGKYSYSGPRHCAQRCSLHCLLKGRRCFNASLSASAPSLASPLSYPSSSESFLRINTSL